MSERIERILDVLLDFERIKVEDYCKRKLKGGMISYDILKELTKGLDEIGKGYGDKEHKIYFTSDLIVSGGNMKKAIEILKPLFKGTGKARGKVVIGTVKGDVHDIGKIIFAIMLESNGFEVIDLGTDVSKESFVEEVRRTKPDILAMSALLTYTVPRMEEVIRTLEAEGLREKVRVIVGGRPVTQEYADKIGADLYGKDAVDGLEKCLSYVGWPKGDE